MAAKNFQPLAEQLLGIEGGVSDRPLNEDPGGLTNMGITQAVYDQWRALRSLPPKSVREITSQEAVAIGKANYWQPIQGDKLPSGVDFAVFDYAFNSGPAQAVKDLQRVLNVAADGIVGLATLEALAVADTEAVINGVCDNRLAFMKKLKNWRANANGWTSRVAHVRAQSLALVGGDAMAAPALELTSAELAKAPPSNAKKPRAFWAGIGAAISSGLAAIGSFIASVPDLTKKALDAISPFSDKSDIAHYFVSGLASVGMAATIFVVWQSSRKKDGAA